MDIWHHILQAVALHWGKWWGRIRQKVNLLTSFWCVIFWFVISSTIKSRKNAAVVDHVFSVLFVLLGCHLLFCAVFVVCVFLSLCCLLLNWMCFFWIPEWLTKNMRRKVDKLHHFVPSIHAGTQPITEMQKHRGYWYGLKMYPPGN